MREQDQFETENNRTIDSGDSEAGEKKWLERSQEAYRDSTSFYESSLNKDWRASIAHFRGEHAPGSKYTTDKYKHRSKVFRPKTRSAMRVNDATLAAALFTNNDIINVAGADPNNEFHAAGAKLNQALLQHRLEKTIPWFMTAIGAYQDTKKYGICISKQYWEYEETEQEPVYEAAIDEMGQPVLDPETGTPMGYEVPQGPKILKDEPRIDLIPPDNFRYDPNADWRDPVGTSPYLIELMPMFAADVLAMMTNDSEKTGTRGWVELTLQEIVAKGRTKAEGQTVEQARQGDKEDRREIDVQHDYTTVWVHFNIMRDEQGKDWAFYTLTDQTLLTEPKPLDELYKHGREIYRVGVSSVETHTAFPDSDIKIASQLQEEINDVANQRYDNVKLVLNKRYALRRGARIDMAALMRNTPGGGVLTDNPETDIKVMDTPDVTGSSYSEQDRLSVEADELLGTFSQSSVQSNRNLNETVGGMNLMSSGANQVQELGIRVFIETWVEPVLRTMIKLEGWYETDEVILQLAANKADILGQVTDDLIQQELTVSVNVGMGNTNPDQKAQRLLMPINAGAQFPEFAERLDFVALGKELFAIGGLADGERFILDDEKFAEKQQAIQASQQGQQDPRLAVEQMRLEYQQQRDAQEMQLKQQELEYEREFNRAKLQSDFESKMAKIASDESKTLEKLYQDLGIAQQNDKTKREIAALQQRNISNEMALKRELGSGI